MSTENGEFFPDAGGRLRTERERLCLSQDAACALLGIKDPKTWRSYEAGKTAPKMPHLIALALRGFDINFVLTGKYSPDLSVEQTQAEYILPAQSIAAEIAGMNLDQEDADALLAVARRLEKKT